MRMIKLVCYDVDAQICGMGSCGGTPIGIKGKRLQILGEFRNYGVGVIEYVSLPTDFLEDMENNIDGFGRKIGYKEVEIINEDGEMSRRPNLFFHELPAYNLKKLLERISDNNEKSQISEQEQDNYHEKCKDNIQSLIYGEFGNISKTIEKMFDSGTDIGCDHCKNVGKYAKAYLEKDIQETKRLEEEYGINPLGTSMFVDGIFYIDPDVQGPG